MAKILLQGAEHTIELTIDNEDGSIIATCTGPNKDAKSCDWTERYDDLRDAVEYAPDHADNLLN